MDGLYWDLVDVEQAPGHNVAPDQLLNALGAAMVAGIRQRSRIVHTRR